MAKYEANKTWTLVIGVNNTAIFKGYFDSGQIETNETVKQFETEAQMIEYITTNSVIIAENI